MYIENTHWKTIQRLGPRLPMSGEREANGSPSGVGGVAQASQRHPGSLQADSVQGIIDDMNETVETDSCRFTIGGLCCF